MLMHQPEAHGVRAAPLGWVGALRNVGPGVVLTGSIVGAGELLVTTRMGAEVGFVFLWGVILACLVKFFIQLELGRQCILRDKTTIQLLDLVPGWRLKDTAWIVWLCVAGYFSVMLTLIGILGSVAGLMVVILPAFSERVWAALVFVCMSLLLWRGLYKDLERIVLALVAGFSLVNVVAVLMLQGTPYAIAASDIASGFRFAMPAEGAFLALAVMGGVGATAVELFMYPYWIREKGYPAFVGPHEDTPEWHARYRGWMRVLAADASVCTGIALVVTCGYYLLGASVLARLKVIPEGMSIVAQISLVFTETFGGWSYGLFMFGSFCVLFSTLVVVAASSGRICVDFMRQLGVPAVRQQRDYERWKRLLQVGFPLFWLIAILVEMDTLAFVLKGANVNNILLIPLSYAVLHLAMRERAELRMSLGVELALLLTLWSTVTFTTINLLRLLVS